MYVYMGGQFLSQVVILLNALFMDWPKEILLISTIIPAAVGKRVKGNFRNNRALVDVAQVDLVASISPFTPSSQTYQSHMRGL